MPGVPLVPRRPAQLRRPGARQRPTATPDDVAVVADSQTRDPIELTWAELADAGARVAPPGCADSASAPAIGSLRTRRTSPRRSSPSSPRRRSGRSGRAAHPSSACDRWSTASPRSSRRVLVAIDGYRYGAKDDRPARPRRRDRRPPCRRCATWSHVPYLAARRRAAPACRRGGRSAVARLGRAARRRAGELAFTPVRGRPPAVRAVQLGHHRAAQGDRPRPRRHRRRAPQGARPAPRPRPGRSLLLVHHHRLDDVELQRVGAAVRLDGRAVRRRPGVPVARRRCGTSRRADGHHGVRHVGVVPDGVPQGRPDARLAVRSAASARPDRRCRPTGSAGSSTRSASRSPRSAAAPTSARAFIGSSTGAAVAGGRDRRPVRSAARSRRSPPTARRARPASPASSSSPSRCRRCRSGSGATPTARAYRAAYFDDYPGVWRHGDWITFNDDGSCVVTGRSDATLNRGGVRLGTSDFYTVVEAFAEVTDSLVVHVEDDTRRAAAWAS